MGRMAVPLAPDTDLQQTMHVQNCQDSMGRMAGLPIAEPDVQQTMHVHAPGATVPVFGELPSQPIIRQCGEAERGSWYRIAYLGGIDLRSGPNFTAPRTGLTLHQNEMFHVSQEIVGADGRIYLLLSDGRGWAFDDSALLPHDPSVSRIVCTPAAPPHPGVLQPMHTMPPPGPTGTAPHGTREHAVLSSVPVYSQPMLQQQREEQTLCGTLFGTAVYSQPILQQQQQQQQQHQQQQQQHQQQLEEQSLFGTAAPSAGSGERVWYAVPFPDQWDPESGPPPWDA